MRVGLGILLLTVANPLDLAQRNPPPPHGAAMTCTASRSGSLDLKIIRSHGRPTP